MTADGIPEPTGPHDQMADRKIGETAEQAEVLQNEYQGQAARDGIPANGTAPRDDRGPNDLGA